MENNDAKMSAQMISGRKLAAAITADLATEIEEASSRGWGSIRPCLAVLLVGDRTDSATYVRMKRKKAEQMGIDFRLLKFPESVEHFELRRRIIDLNEDDTVHGIIVQLPLPAHLNEGAITSIVEPAKDVDGFHSENAGRLLSVGGSVRPHFVACTARGVMRMLHHAVGGEQGLRGKVVTLVGTGNVGKPLSLLLQRESATVVCCNKFTPNIASLTQQADIVVAACGVPRLVKADWVKPGAVVIDVGINSLDGKLVGDVDYENVRAALGPDGWISPVPGGVGPMTVAMLMTAVVEAWR